MFLIMYSGLTCAAAAVPNWYAPSNVWYPSCDVRRPWGCHVPQPSQSYLLCTCAPIADVVAYVAPPTPTSMPVESLLRFQVPSTPPVGASLPTSSPVFVPLTPSSVPNYAPSNPPVNPTSVGSSYPSSSSPMSLPTVGTTTVPFNSAVASPSAGPSVVPSIAPSSSPVSAPSFGSTNCPTAVPSSGPVYQPTVSATLKPSTGPSIIPSAASSSFKPTSSPMALPTIGTTFVPSGRPNTVPTATISSSPSLPSPSVRPSKFPPTVKPTAIPIAPSTKPTNTPIAPSYKPTKSPVTKRRQLAVEGVHIESGSGSSNNVHNPTVKATRTPTAVSSLPPITLNPPGEFVNPTCLAQLSTDQAQPSQFCTQNQLNDTCTTIIPNRPFGARNGSCAIHCQRHGLQCMKAYNNWGCVSTQDIPCHTISTSYSLVCSSEDLTNNIDPNFHNSNSCLY